ncbi:WYL domain-containing protein [Microbacterium sp. BWT-G7]|uniref:WYL domain-containing protein n=1 Tax=Microbacterium allomyrinae TaxID=2830666 RepID=A0A9X1S320_9MICO|nr:WYL domain-containing protein [Microbacterium allomyrinae]
MTGLLSNARSARRRVRSRHSRKKRPASVRYRREDVLVLKTSSRVLTLLSLLQTRRDWAGGVLAERLEVSPRTVRRDVDRLRKLGYRIRAIKGPEGGYRLEAGSELPPLLFDDDQAVAITIALHAAALSSAGIEDAAERALASIRHVLPERLRTRLDAVDFTAAVESAVPVDPSALAQISAAVRAREELRFDYTRVGAQKDDRADAAPRRIQPHHLVAMNGRWYLIGWSDEHADWRVYRVDRMSLRSHRGQAFTPRSVPGGDPQEFLRARFRGAVSADTWPCRGKVLMHAAAERVTPFVTDGIVDAVNCDTCTLETGAWSWGALAARVMRFEVDVEVLDPPELADAFRALAARAARASGGSTESRERVLG